VTPSTPTTETDEMSEHTKEPWEVCDLAPSGNPYWRGDGTEISSAMGRIADCLLNTFRDIDECRANAARIVACVNACAGIPTDQLSQLSPPDTLAAAEEAVELLREVAGMLRTEGCTTTPVKCEAITDRLVAALENRGR
jgi:hypothetical protein